MSPLSCAWLGLTLAVSVPAVISPPPPPPVTAAPLPVNPGPLPVWAEANAAVALDLYGALGTQPGNLFFSPHSVSSALGLVRLGARGATAEELDHLLRTPAGGGDPAALQSRLQGLSHDGTVLTLANSLWYQTGAALRPEFVSQAQTRFGATVRDADFSREPSAARRAINQWGDQATNHRIPEALPPGTITQATRLLLANAVYFKSRWTVPFRSPTEPRPFFLAAGVKVDVPTMAKTDDLKRLGAPGVDLLELPYQGDELSMILLLPDPGGGLPKLEAKLTAKQLVGWLRDLDAQRVAPVALRLPRLHLVETLDLIPALTRLGVTTLFRGDEADLSGIDGTRQLFVSQALQDSYIDVNETGTEAAAVTGIGVVARMVQRIPPPFTVDHPFLFLIRDRATGTILFLGRVTDPR